MIKIRIGIRHSSYRKGFRPKNLHYLISGNKSGSTKGTISNIEHWMLIRQPVTIEPIIRLNVELEQGLILISVVGIHWWLYN
jgi:hypothetical protein